MKTDVCAMLWKESQEFRHQFQSRISTFAVIMALTSIVFPIIIVQDALAAGLAKMMLDVCIIMGTVFYGLMQSEASFYEERNNGVLQYLLSTSLSPFGIFCGKWLWMLSLCLIFSMIAYPVQFLVIDVYCGKSLEFTVQDLLWSGLMMLFSLSLCSLVISVNAAMSLWVVNTQAGRLMTIVAGYSPLLIALAYNRLLAIPFDSSMIVAVGVTSVFLSILVAIVGSLLFRRQQPVI